MIKVTTINDSKVDITNKVMSWLNSTPSVQPEYENSKYLVYTNKISDFYRII